MEKIHRTILRYNKDPNFKEYYVNGVRGRILGGADLKLEVFRDDLIYPEEEKLERKESETETKFSVTKKGYEEDALLIPRTLQCRLIMSIPTLININDELSKIMERSGVSFKRVNIDQKNKKETTPQLKKDDAYGFTYG
jgi:formyltetrahydrofolate hydrolase